LFDPTPTLTCLLNNRKSHLSNFLDEEFPHTMPLRRSIREACGPIKFPPGTGRDGGAVGSAFDLLTTFVVQPDARLLDLSTSYHWTLNHVALTEVMRDRVTAGIAAPTRTTELYEAVWVLGLLVNSMRSDNAYLASPVTGLLRTSSDIDEVLADIDEIIPPAAIEELRRLDELATLALYPQLAAPAHFHPWLGNRAVQAEADIIAAGVLIDVKTNRGTQFSGGYRLLPALADIYQVIVYALLNRDGWAEEYGEVHTVGIYAARYGTLLTYPLQELVDQLAGTTVNLDNVARQVVMYADQESWDPTR